jgi:hypothetical protein
LSLIFLPAGHPPESSADVHPKKSSRMGRPQGESFVTARLQNSKNGNGLWS